MHSYSYLALGDSYTIGEAVPLQKNFPYQAVQILRQKGYDFYAPEIVAKTGWTTDELEAAMKNYQFLSRYDFVSLLIGVNNQYRGRDLLEYKQQLEALIEKAISLANGKKEQVMLLSIPDYGVTPFAQTKNPEKISREIDVFNTAAKALCLQYKIQYIEITEGSRLAKQQPELVAGDGLHPSEKEYEKWAMKLVDVIISRLK